MTYMLKRIYDNMGVKSSVWTSTIQTQALNWSNIRFDVLDLKMSDGPLYFRKFPLYFRCAIPVGKIYIFLSKE